ncbi:tubulin-like doman-containing protein [Pyrococcus abyssi]|uniref:Tubulin like n=1 Tax=Pyrococcus abyssi (strain GE5 / Orsay) TaxID=272844 RepID=G8ZK11_PYRAB|nr:tubulin-like doman-containing protein [Pyrococcus abyssi]CCE71118.1 TPA: hypothetical protein PAB1257 [Pyrococcus abyssi GE5]
MAVQPNATVKTFPDVIIGVGGAGKLLIFSMLQKEWFIRELLKYTKESNERVTFVIVDTARAELSKDREALKEIEKKIDKIAKEMKVPKNVHIVLKCLIEDLHITNPYNLYDLDLLRKVKEGVARVWWLYDNEFGIDYTEGLKIYTSGFDFGTLRRRAVTKAMLYKAIAEGIVADIFQLRGKVSNVAMIVGLGGGTGSGLFIDLAKYLKDSKRDANITLFGILPSLKEDEVAKANAFVAVSELEYLMLHGEHEERLFSNVVLATIAPTEVQTTPNAWGPGRPVEFEEIFPYIFLNIYIAGNKGDLRGTPYGSFVLATAGILTYDIQGILQNQELLNTALAYLKTRIHKEREIREQFDGFLSTLQSEGLIELKDEINIFKPYLEIARNRIAEFFKTFIDNRILRIFQYDTPIQLEKAISKHVLTPRDQISTMNLNQLEEYLSSLEAAILKTEVTAPKNETDKELLELAKLELQNIRQMIYQIKKAHMVTLEPLGPELSQFTADFGGLIRDLVTLEVSPQSLKVLLTIKEYLDDLINKNEASLRKLRREFDELQEIKRQYTSQVARLISEISPSLTEYYTIFDVFNRVLPVLKELNSKIEHFVQVSNDIIVAEEEDIAEGTPEAFESEINSIVEEIKQRAESIIRQVGDNPLFSEILKDLVREVEKISEIIIEIYNQKYWCYKSRHASFVEKITGKARVYKDECENAEDRISNLLNNLGFPQYIMLHSNMGIVEGVEAINIVSTIGEIVSKELSRIGTNIEVKTLDNIRLGDLDISLEDIAKKSRDYNEFLHSVEETILRELLAYKGISTREHELKSEIDKLSVNVQKLSQLKEKIARIENNIRDIRDLIDEYSEIKRNMKSQFDKLDKALEEREQFSRKSETYKIIYDPDPTIVGVVQRMEGANLAKVFSELAGSNILQKEAEKLRNYLEELISRLTSPPYSGIIVPSKEVVEIKPPVRWEVNRVYTFINTVGVNSEVLREKIFNKNFQEELSRKLSRDLDISPMTGAGMPRVAVDYQDISGPWDIAVTLIFTGVFLEDIYGVFSRTSASIGSDPISYYASYLNKKKEGLNSEIFHHVYKLEDGWYIERKPIKIEDAILLAKETNIEKVREEMKEYVEKVSIIQEGREGGTEQ